MSLLDHLDSTVHEVHLSVIMDCMRVPGIPITDVSYHFTTPVVPSSDSQHPESETPKIRIQCPVSDVHSVLYTLKRDRTTTGMIPI